ncbi:BTB/POZ domain-containing protein 2-like [Sitodiplosis mosellana]|uniref:BTB/POZ domain-containing protein 2-like n=1 Tax=Sitodiplosis mosellana TaxID=263140 RepID=UPI002443A19C|nr:BTB/POZ domain-containing protein 2-like [Sitodiplosis mosellana]
MNRETAFEAYFLDEKSADVHFISDDRQSEVRVPAHEIILAAQSKAFHAMFYGSLPEEGDVRLPVIAKACKQFLQLFYLTEVELTLNNENEKEVLHLSNMYQIGLNEYENSLKKNLSTDNFITFYELALLHDLTELKSSCEISAPVLLSEESVVKSTRDEFKHILQIKQLYVEMDLVGICVQWAQTACEARQIGPESMDDIVQEIGDLIECFDFESMSRNKIREVLNMFDAVLTKNTYRNIINILMTRDTPFDVACVTCVTPHKVVWYAKETAVRFGYFGTGTLDRPKF